MTRLENLAMSLEENANAGPISTTTGTTVHQPTSENWKENSQLETSNNNTTTTTTTDATTTNTSPILSSPQVVPVRMVSCGSIPWSLLPNMGLYTGTYNMHLHILQFVCVLRGCSSETHLDQDYSVHVVDIG